MLTLIFNRGHVTPGKSKADFVRSLGKVMGLIFNSDPGGHRIKMNKDFICKLGTILTLIFS